MGLPVSCAALVWVDCLWWVNLYNCLQFVYSCYCFDCSFTVVWLYLGGFWLCLLLGALLVFGHGFVGLVLIAVCLFDCLDLFMFVCSTGLLGLLLICGAYYVLLG